jgi:anaerobic selenocysteine-containing dehydrogenase
MARRARAGHKLSRKSQPKMDRDYSWTYIYDNAYRGVVKGLLTFGMNPVGNGPHSKKMIRTLAKLDWMVVVENFETETAAFWRSPKEYEGPETKEIRLSCSQGS